MIKKPNLARMVFTLCAAGIALALGGGRCPGQSSLSVGTVAGYPGATVAVPVMVHNASNMVAAQFDVAFDSSKVGAFQSLLGARLTNHVIRSRQLAPGVQRVLIYSLTNAMVGRSNMVAAGVRFAISPDERTNSGPIVPGNVLLSKLDATALAPLESNAGEIFITPAHRNADGSASFFFSSAAGTNYVIQATTNLVDWVNISTNLAPGLWLDLLDPEATNHPVRFYRTVR